MIAIELTCTQLAGSMPLMNLCALPRYCSRVIKALFIVMTAGLILKLLLDILRGL